MTDPFQQLSSLLGGPRKVEDFLGVIFGSTLGYLIDQGWSDQDIKSEVDRLLRGVRSIKNDPEVFKALSMLQAKADR